MRTLRLLVMIGMALAGGGSLAAHAQSCVASSQVTLSGTLRSANGLPSSNDVITLTPSQQGYIAGCGVNLATANTCATSTDGSVVGLANPLNATIVTANPGTGTLAAGTYYVVYAFYSFDGDIFHTLISPETVVQLSSQGSIVVNSPASGIPSGAQGMLVYIGTTSGGELLQASTTGTNAWVQTGPATGTGVLPTANTTACKVTANDAIWPAGTGYKVSMVDSSGNAIPGYPMQWQLQGPGTTINLSNGLPYYHGVVMFPVPILAAPTAHGTQSISGSLDMSGYNLQNLSRLGIGTSLPAYPLDIRNGFANLSSGVLLSGDAGASGQCLASGGASGPDTWINCLTNVGTIYYQQIQNHFSGLTPRPVLNFGTYFDLNDDGNHTNVELHRNGTDPYLATATASGVSGHCAQWDANGGVTDSGSPCSGGSGTDYYFEFDTCTIAETGNFYSCFGTTSLASLSLPNTNYSIQCEPRVPLISGSWNINATSLSTTTLPYVWTQIMGNGTSGSAVGAHMYCHIHMN